MLGPGGQLEGEIILTTADHSGPSGFFRLNRKNMPDNQLPIRKLIFFKMYLSLSDAVALVIAGKSFPFYGRCVYDVQAPEVAH